MKRRGSAICRAKFESGQWQQQKLPNSKRKENQKKISFLYLLQMASVLLAKEQLMQERDLMRDPV
jgi:hypothetical protein